MRNAIAVAVLLTVATAALAQSESPSVPLSAHGGEIRIVTKDATSSFSGSLSFMTGFGSSLGGGDTRGYGASAGGTLLKDRAWFYASGEQRQSTLVSQFGGLPLATGDGTAFDAKLTTNLGDRNSLVGSYSNRDLQTAAPFSMSLPSSFLSLNYTGVVSSNMFFNASVSRSRTTQTPWVFTPASQP